MKALRVGLAIGIALLFPLLTNMTVRIFAEPPDYNEYYQHYELQPKNAKERDKAEAEYKTKSESYEAAYAKFNTLAFYVTYPLGLLALLAGYRLRSYGTIAGGLLFGGLFTIAFGSYSCWETLPGWQRYVSLLFTLGVLAVLGWLLDRQARAPAS